MTALFESPETFWCLVIVCAPLAALLATASIAVFDAPVNERVTNRITQGAIGLSLLATLAVLAGMISRGERTLAVELGDWIALPDLHFHFTLKFLFDGLSIPFLILALLLSGVVGAFARVYLHRESGYRRFYLLFTVFVLGMCISSLAGTVETLFAGWELVGLSSALLVAFFQNRPAPVRNGLHVWTVYRVADAAFLAAAVALHHVAAEGDFVRMTGAHAWPDGQVAVSPSVALGVGLLLLVAAAGKSGLVPFSGWLPRAMEGPTPSSAIFYGALSVHLGAFLLLRSEALLERSAALSGIVVVVGITTAAWATLAARVQPDIKSVLAFASLTQVGIIVAEIGLGLRAVAVAHIVGHACLRTLQILRTPSLLHDDHQMENAIGAYGAAGRSAPAWLDRLPPRWAATIYRIGYEREFFEIQFERLFLGPYRALLTRCGLLERRWMAWLSGSNEGGASR